MRKAGAASRSRKFRRRLEVLQRLKSYVFFTYFFTSTVWRLPNMFVKLVSYCSCISVFLYLGACSFTTPAMTEQSTKEILARFDAQDTERELLAERVDELVFSQHQLSDQLFQLKYDVGDLNETVQKTAYAQKKSTKSIQETIKSDITPKSDKLAKMTLGRVEWIWVDRASSYFKTQVDTSVASSTIYAKTVQHFERDGEKWIRFTVAVDHDGKEVMQTIEAPIVKKSKVKSDEDQKDSDKKNVVSLLVNVGGQMDEQDFSISDKKPSGYTIVLGRNFLRDIAIVDVAQKFIHKRENELEEKSKKYYDALLAKSNSSQKK